MKQKLKIWEGTPRGRLLTKREKLSEGPGKRGRKGGLKTYELVRKRKRCEGHRERRSRQDGEKRKKNKGGGRAGSQREAKEGGDSKKKPRLKKKKPRCQLLNAS